VAKGEGGKDIPGEETRTSTYHPFLCLLLFPFYLLLLIPSKDPCPLGLSYRDKRVPLVDQAEETYPLNSHLIICFSLALRPLVLSLRYFGGHPQRELSPSNKLRHTYFTIFPSPPYPLLRKKGSLRRCPFLLRFRHHHSPCKWRILHPLTRKRLHREKVQRDTPDYFTEGKEDITTFPWRVYSLTSF